LVVRPRSQGGTDGIDVDVVAHDEDANVSRGAFEDGGDRTGDGPLRRVHRNDDVDERPCHCWCPARRSIAACQVSTSTSEDISRAAACEACFHARTWSTVSESSTRRTESASNPSATAPLPCSLSRD